YTITFASQLGNVVLTSVATELKRNEVQVLTVKQTAGTYTLTDGTNFTGPITFDASAADVQSALQTLFGLQKDQISVANTSKPDPQSQATRAGLVGTEEVYSVTFLGHISEPLLVANVSTLVDAGTFTLVQTNPNLLVDPAAQVNILTLNDD